MAKMKKSNVRGKSKRAIEMEAAKKQEEIETREKGAAKQKQKKENMKQTGRTMLGIYSLVASVFSWLLDWMGVISLAGTVLGVLGIVKLKDNKDKYFWMSAAAAGVGGVRFIMQMVQLILYFAK